MEGPERVNRFFAYLFASHDRDHEQLPPPPEELVEWSQDTMLAAFAGMVLAGGKQWQEERRAGPPRPPPDAPTPAHAARFIAEEQTQRMIRIFDASIKGALRVGSVAALYYGVQLLSGIYRAQQDFLNSAYGGVAAGALFGAFGPTASKARVRSIVLGAALGGSIGVPAGFLQEKIVTMLPPEQQEARQIRTEKMEKLLRGEQPVLPAQQSERYNASTTAAIIEQLETSLASSPTQQKKQKEEEQQIQEKGGWFRWFTSSKPSPET